ncbi:MAG: PD-(D/E)XK nuclease family protein [Nanoarchaeota archaeon]|nr:PD-(D/E)XK nuclease family protein [Nanoarchaeota archaeon]
MTEIYSHSRLSTFEKCPLKFKFQYIDKIIVIEKSVESFLGKRVHEALEWFYRQIKNTQKIPEVDELINFYSNSWEKEYDSRKIIVNNNLTEKDYFNMGLKFILNYYTKNHPFDDNTIDIEKKIAINLDELGEYKLIGFIDRLSQNKQTGNIEIHDYKTSNSLPRKGMVDDDRQLALYAIAIKNEFGQDKDISLIWHYLAFNQKICSKRTDEQLEALKKQILELIKKIEKTIEFHPNKSPLCNWCEYQSMCPCWQEYPSEKVLEMIKKRENY